MDQSPIVGRDDILNQLIRILTQAWNHHGSIVFIEGVAGMGKTMLLKMLQQEVKRFPELERTTFVEGSCYESTGYQNAYQPFIDILETLAKLDIKSKGVGKLTLNILKETAPDWLQIVPVIGAALGAGVKTASIAGHWFLETHSETQANQSKSLITQYINALIKLASQQPLLVLIIEDGHWIDDASSQLLLRLASKIAEIRMVVLVTYRPDYLNTQHPLKKVQREMLIKNWAQVIPLTGLTEEQIQLYLLKRFDAVLHPKLASWIEHLCNGNPMFVTQYLSLLEQDQIIRRVNNTYIFDGEIHYVLGKWRVSGTLAEMLIPNTVEMVLEQRIERLFEEDREMLQLGAVQGDWFMSLLLAELLAKKELDVLSRLRQVIERHQIVSLYAGEEWFKKRSELYIFEHHLMQQAFYKKLSPRERFLHHSQVAQLLERMLNQQPNSPRRLLLEVAYHYSLGNEPISAAQYYFQAAQSSFMDGAFVETIDLCETAYVQLQQITGQDHLLVEVIQLLLIASEIRWRGKPELQGKLQPRALAEEAEAAARQTGDMSLLARIQYLKGFLGQVTENLEQCLLIYKEALQTAKQAGDQLGEFIIMSELGHSTVGKDLAEGLRLMYEAHDLYTRMLTTQTIADAKALDRYYRRLQGLIGVGEFDRGQYDAAQKLLNESVKGLKRLGMPDDLSRFGNFLGQFNTATGLFEEAELVLKEAIDVHKEEDEPNAWRAYNLALLGKLYIEWERIDDAVIALSRGWQETKTTWNIALVSLVRNYYAELLMHPNNKARDPVMAKQLLDTTLEETRTNGFLRSMITALSLHSRLALLQGLIEPSLKYSIQAMDQLQHTGIRSALRVEEILFNHYQALKATKCEQEAIDCLKQAHEIVQQKARTIQDATHRYAFLERVPVSKAIVTAFHSFSKVGLSEVKLPNGIQENHTRQLDF